MHVRAVVLLGVHGVPVSGINRVSFTLVVQRVLDICGATGNLFSLTRPTRCIFVHAVESWNLLGALTQLISALFCWTGSIFVLLDEIGWVDRLISLHGSCPGLTICVALLHQTWVSSRLARLRPCLLGGHTSLTPMSRRGICSLILSVRVNTVAVPWGWHVPILLHLSGHLVPSWLWLVINILDILV